MKLRITIDIFSGRENPVIELEGKEATEALARLEPARALEKDEPGLPPSTLGYRGLIVEQIGVRSSRFPDQFKVVTGKLLGADLAHRLSDETFEDLITGSRGLLSKAKMGEGFDQFLAAEMVRCRQLDAEYAAKKIVWPLKPVCPCAPLYEPQWWNDGGQKQLHNNCYNYSTDYRTDSFRVISGGGQPGAAAGAMYTAITGAAVKDAAVKDDLIDSPAADNKCPGQGHLVALVIAPGWDFHWYRKGRNGRWSHKPGSTAVTNLDNSGNTILDPRTANRGPYTEFCTFMVVMHGHIKIK
jgi:hypothetical protein